MKLKKILLKIPIASELVDTSSSGKNNSNLDDTNRSHNPEEGQ